MPSSSSRNSNSNTDPIERNDASTSSTWASPSTSSRIPIWRPTLSERWERHERSEPHSSSSSSTTSTSTPTRGTNEQDSISESSINPATLSMRSTPGLEAELLRLRQIARREQDQFSHHLTSAYNIRAGHSNRAEAEHNGNEDDQDGEGEEDDDDDDGDGDDDDDDEDELWNPLDYLPTDDDSRIQRDWDRHTRNMRMDEDEEDIDDDDDDDDDDDGLHFHLTHDMLDEEEGYEEDEVGIDDPAYWPGLLIERPLNTPGPSPLRYSYTHPTTATSTAAAAALASLSPPPLAAPKSESASYSIDPSSSTSPSSFLRVGAVFSGSQVFEVRVPKTTPRSSDTTNRPSSRLRTGPSSTTSTHDAARYLADAAFVLPHMNSDYNNFTSNSTSQILNPRFSNRPSSASTTTVREGLAIMRNELAATVRRIGSEELNAFYNRRMLEAGWHPSALDGAGLEDAADAGGHMEEKEKWDVKVIINSYDSKAQTISGLMHASGVPASASQVTTYFTGEIIDVAVEPLWSPIKWGSKQRTDAESWTKLGPFKGLSAADLIKKSSIHGWVEDTTEGYVLMRWKEKDFINVTPAESRLSIAGYYYIMLERSTGILEGLYHDPNTTPSQRLMLSPMTTKGAPFALGIVDRITRNISSENEKLANEFLGQSLARPGAKPTSEMSPTFHLLLPTHQFEPISVVQTNDSFNNTMTPKGQPQVGDHLVVTYPIDKVIQLRLNRPNALNAMTDALEADLRKILDWFEEEPSLWVVIVTGTGRAFCAGQGQPSEISIFVPRIAPEVIDEPIPSALLTDLKDWNSNQSTSGTSKIKANPYGFASIARRQSRKIIIAAVQGICLGGGAELLVNCDINIGLDDAVVGFPEVKRGVIAAVGGIPNAYQRSPQLSPYLLTGINIPTPLLKAHVFTQTVASADQVLPAALEWASKIVECSPDAVQVTKDQINMCKAGNGLFEVVKKSMDSELAENAYKGENMKEGLRSFVEKRLPRWTNPAPLSKSKL